MNMIEFTKRHMDERLFNSFFYYYLHLKRGVIPKKLDLKNPTTFNEKTIWLKINQRYDNASVLADKVLVKDFVSDIIGDQYLIPNIGVYDTPEEINFDLLPNSFVMKPNHGSGWIVTCPDKTLLDVAETRRLLKKWLGINYFDIGKEYQYRDIKPKILCETYLECTPENPLIDYKIFCFSGVPRYIQVDLDRFTNHTRSFYDLNWQVLPFTTLYPKAGKTVPKPDSLDEMLSIAEKLSRDLVFARIDLYNHKGQIYFGEITLHHGGGFEPFMPSGYDLALGTAIAL